jgi:hypothetical protein
MSISQYSISKHGKYLLWLSIAFVVTEIIFITMRDKGVTHALISVIASDFFPLVATFFLIYFLSKKRYQVGHIDGWKVRAKRPCSFMFNLFPTCTIAMIVFTSWLLISVLLLNMFTNTNHLDNYLLDGQITAAGSAIIFYLAVMVAVGKGLMFLVMFTGINTLLAKFEVTQRINIHKESLNPVGYFSFISESIRSVTWWPVLGLFSGAMLLDVGAAYNLQEGALIQSGVLRASSKIAFLFGVVILFNYTMQKKAFNPNE